MGRGKLILDRHAPEISDIPPVRVNEQETTLHNEDQQGYFDGTSVREEVLLQLLPLSCPCETPQNCLLLTKINI